MKDQIFVANSLSTKRKKNETTIENSYGAVDISKENDRLSVDFRRKNEHFEETHENSREKLEDGHKTSQKTSSGEVTVDSKNKHESAVEYEESASSSNAKIMKNLYKLKSKIYNQTLEELLPEDQAVFVKIQSEINREKMKSQDVILHNLKQVEQQIIDDGVDENQDTDDDDM